MKHIKWTTSLIASMLMVGCATPDNRPAVRAKVNREVTRVQEANTPAGPVVRRVEGAYVKARTTDYVAPSEEVSLKVAKGNLQTALQAIAQPKGYTIVMAQGLETKPVNVELVSMEFERAVREIAAAAGAAAVFDRSRRAIYIAAEATYTFQVPQHLFGDLAMTYNVSSNPSAQTGAGGQGGAGQPGGGGAPTGGATTGGPGGATPGANNTNMRVTGGAGSVTRSFELALRQIAGENASISMIPETGFVSVRADGTVLRRVTTFLEGFSRNAGRQVQLKAALIEITLANEESYGVDWNRVLNRSGRNVNIGIATLGVVPSAVVNATITTSSITSVIKALESEQLVKVVAEPELWMLNHQPGIVYAATQRPYLGSVTTTVSGNANITSTSGSLSYVQDGVSLAFRPNILDNSRAELTVIPVLSTAVNPQTFKPGNGLELTGFDLPTSSTHMKLLLEAGKTYIVGGNRFTTDNFNQAGIPGVRQTPIIGPLLSGTDDRKRTKELVLMLSTTIVPAPDLNIVVGESL